MKILITGGCGFVGSNLCLFLKKSIKNANVFSLDNLFRPGSKINEKRLKKNNIKNFRVDIFNYNKIKKLPKFNLIIDCCAEPSIEASKNDMDRVIKTNLLGSYNILKKCITDSANIIFLSSSRVYSISELKKSKNILLNKNQVNEKFDTSGIKSIYGWTKFCSEELIKEINYTHNIKYLINRFGVISGSWQFGKQDQGFVTLWMARHMLKKNLSYIGFDGLGNQSRDIIHIEDVCNIILRQIQKLKTINNQIFNIGGGIKNNISLRELTSYCEKITGNKIKIKKIKKTSIYDVPAYVTDNRKIIKTYKWKPEKNILNILEDIYLWFIRNKKILDLYK